VEQQHFTCTPELQVTGGHNNALCQQLCIPSQNLAAVCNLRMKNGIRTQNVLVYAQALLLEKYLYQLCSLLAFTAAGIPTLRVISKHCCCCGNTVDLQLGGIRFRLRPAYCVLL
jgi:hypothetical protein